MALAPRHIVDSLECVVSLFFSDVRHQLRAAFILCDELVETACREKIRETIPGVGKMHFHQTISHATVGLNPATSVLGASVSTSHRTRNDMQHANPAATVDVQHCADSILDAVETIEHCFPGSKGAFPENIQVALRVLHLLSRQGDRIKRATFIGLMQRHHWRRDIPLPVTPGMTGPRFKKPSPLKTESLVSPGERANWGLVILSETAAIKKMLDDSGAP